MPPEAATALLLVLAWAYGREAVAARDRRESDPARIPTEDLRAARRP